MTAEPEVSVVVSSKNRVTRLAALLETLRAQDFDRGRFEVVVVDNASTDGTFALLQRESEAGELNLRPIRLEVDRGIAHSRDLGWRAAGGKLIAFTDDDCEASTQWLSALVQAWQRHPRAVLQGRTEPIPRERSALDLPFARTKEVTSLGPFYETCNVAYPRSVLEHVDGFDAEAFPTWGGEDTDLAWRAFEAGADAVFVDRALTYHAVNQLGPMGMLRLASGWSHAMGVFARHPGMRRHLHHGIFWKRSHELLLVSAAGALLVRRTPLALLLLIPYLRVLRVRADGASWLIPYLALRDSIELFAAVRGAVRHRTLVI